MTRTTVDLTPTGPEIGSRGSWARFLAGFAALYATLAGLGSIEPGGRWGVPILAAVVLAGIVVEKLLNGSGPRGLLGTLGRPAVRPLVLAAAVSALVLLAFPLTGLLSGAAVTLRPDWIRLLFGIFAFHGLAEELVWRGYAFRRLRVGRSYRSAVLWTMPLVAATHVPIIATAGVGIGLGAMLVAALTSLSFSYLYETGNGTVWAPALVHTAIDAFKLVVVPAAAASTLPLVFVGVGLVVPLLALLVPRRWLDPHPASPDQIIHMAHPARSWAP